MAREANVIKFRMGKGWNGQLSRVGSFLETAHLKGDNIPNYGTAVKYDGDYVVPLGRGDTAEKVAGFLSRPYGTHSFDDLKRMNNSGEYNYTGDIMKKGYMLVYVANSTGVQRGEPVYIRVANPSANSPIGAILTSATDAEKLPNCYFMSDADESGIAEIAYKI